MKATAHQTDWMRVLFVLLMVLPIAVLFLLPGGATMLGAIWLWLFLLLCFWMLFWAVGAPARASVGSIQRQRPLRPEVLPPETIPEGVHEVMDVRLAAQQEDVEVFRGPLKEPPDAAFQRLKQTLGDRGVPFLQEDETFGAAVVVVPKPAEPEARKRTGSPWINWLLFALTLITTTWAGAAHAGVNVLQDPARITAGLPYALGLMAILGIHELGHYFTARYHGIDVTPPYFIPVPFALGTFGAFIQMKSPTENRKALFDVAVAGPIAGLVVAIPALLIGLHSSAVVQTTASPDAMGHMGAGTTVGSSILFAVLSKLALGSSLQYGHVLRLSPLAFAGWLGLFITALNLLPIGQLDGGHMAQGMFGTRIGSTISRVAMWTLFLLALFVWPGLFMWAIIIFFLAGRPMPPLNDLTPITPGRRALGWVMFAVLALIIAPLPHAFWSAAGIHCPYL